MHTLSLRCAACALAFVPAVLAAQTQPQALPAPRPTGLAALPASVDSLSERLRRAESAIVTLRRQLVEQTEAQASSSAQNRPTSNLELSGRILTNGFFNSGRVNNVDNPQYADTASSYPHGLGATMRHTRVAATYRSDNVLKGTFEGALNADFHGGQQPSAGGRAFPLIRLRTATATLRWAGLSLLLGQESPLIGGLDPVSPTAVGTPLFAGAGNLWLWIPQARFGFERVGALRLGAQAAVLAPTGGDPAGAFETGNDVGERTYRPFVQGRVYARFGPEGLVSEVGCGVHKGWLQPVNAIVSSDAVACDANLAVLTGLDFRGEFFTGKALNSLGGGGIGQNFTLADESLPSTGGWVQVNMAPVPEFKLGAGCGIDHPDAVATRMRNDACAAYTIVQPPGPFFVGAEYRRMRTDYATGRFDNQYVTVAAGFAFGSLR